MKSTQSTLCLETIALSFRRDLLMKVRFFRVAAFYMGGRDFAVIILFLSFVLGFFFVELVRSSSTTNTNIAMKNR